MYKEIDPKILTTPIGLVMLEIQGELNLPASKPDSLTEEESANYIKDSIYDAVKFGDLQIDKDKVTLLIGKSQRLVGSCETLGTPLAVLRFPQDSLNEENIQIVDIIRKKFIFKQRPLPIM